MIHGPGPFVKEDAALLYDRKYPERPAGIRA